MALACRRAQSSSSTSLLMPAVSTCCKNHHLTQTIVAFAMLQVEARLRDCQSSEAMLRQQLITMRDRRMGGGGPGCMSCVGGS